MKKLILAALLVVPFIANAQYPDDNHFTIYLTVKTDQADAVPFVDLWLTEKGSKEKIVATTNNQGRVELEVRRGKNYLVSFGDQKDVAELTTPLRGQTYYTKTITYNPPDAGIISATMDTVIQKISGSDKAGDNEARVNLRIKTKTEAPLRNSEVRLVSNRNKKVYIAQTNNMGEAKFLVPCCQNYDIGIEDIDEYKALDLPDRGRLTINKGFNFQPTEVTETVSNDTIKQRFDHNGPTSARAYVNMYLHNPSGEPLADENIFVDVKNSNTVYHATSDERGIAKFLLPKGVEYILHFEYERGVDVLDFTEKKGFRHVEIEYSYMGSERIRNYFAGAKRDKNGFRIEFMETPVQRIAFDDSNIEQTDQGFNINMPKQVKTPSPTVAEDMIFVDGGYYTNSFYGFDKENGQFRWGVGLGESGSSSAVYDDGVLLLITESCTLYALEVGTGRLLWSKWLGPNIYSSPTVAHGKVYAVYPNELGDYLNFQANEEIPHNNVVACFDLKTGAIAWQNWMDSEVLASAVLNGNSVYLTSVAGKLYQFNKDNGEMTSFKNVGAVTPPTVVKDKLFVTIRDDKDPSKEKVAIYSSKDLKLIKKADQLSSLSSYPDLASLDADFRMNYNGSRILHYKGKNFNVMADKLYCSDPESGNVLWSASLPGKAITDDKPTEGMPVVVNGQILVPIKSGMIQVYNPETGKLVKEFDTGATPNNQTIVDNGWIYTGTVEGKLVSINTKDSKLTGWPMWGLNSSHNPVIE